MHYNINLLDKRKRMSFKPFAHFTILINSPEKKMYMANARPQNGYAKVNLQLDFKSLQCPLMCSATTIELYNFKNVLHKLIIHPLLWNAFRYP